MVANILRRDFVNNFTIKHYNETLKEIIWVIKKFKKFKKCNGEKVKECFRMQYFDLTSYYQAKNKNVLEYIMKIGHEIK